MDYSKLSDPEFLRYVKDELDNGKSLPQIAEGLRRPAPTIYSRIDRLGYEVESETTRTLVPKTPTPMNDAA
jgi:hypothetical protein